MIHGDPYTYSAMWYCRLYSASTPQNLRETIFLKCLGALQTFQSVFMLSLA